VGDIPMNWLHTLLLLLATFLVVFGQASFDGARHLLGAQVDLLPSLVVYASLSSGLSALLLVSIGGGLGADSLSANPLGISVLPLFLVGFVIQRYRGLILRDQFLAQLFLGLGASAVVPVLTLLLLINTEKPPLVGWFSLWQWFVVSVAGGMAAPLWFRLVDRAMSALSYRPWDQTSFRADREIKRGRGY
jgi:hypothetical protein